MSHRTRAKGWALLALGTLAIAACVKSEAGDARVSIGKAAQADDASTVSFGGACEKTFANEGGTGPIAGQGMQQEWEEIQAEDASVSGGLTIGPCRTKWDARHIEAEAIGRKAVVLQQTGDSVKFHPASSAADSIVVRYSVPDTGGGGGQDYTLSLYRNNVRVTKLTLTSKYSWNYRGALMNDPSTDVPGPQPHTFFDEVRFIDPHPNDGADWELRRDGDDTAAFYVIDLADFEKVPAPQAMPDGFTNVETLGIHPDDGVDHANDLERALSQVGNPQSFAAGPKLWFPPGEYIFQDFNKGLDGSTPPDGLGLNVGVDCHNCSIQGAGMWHTKFTGRKAMFFCEGLNSTTTNFSCHFSDFSIIGNSTQRNEPTVGPQKGFAGPMGQNSTITRVWVEHTVAGIWIGGDNPDQPVPTQNLTISDCRVRNTYADGINLCNGTSNTTVSNVHIRSTGDDAIAMWSVQWTHWVRDQDVANPGFISDRSRPITGSDGVTIIQNGDQGQETGNTVQNASVQMPWRADCFAVYGGAGHTFQDSTCEDVLTYPGILVDNEFSSYAFGPAVTSFKNITLKRAGGEMFYEDSIFPWVHGALKFYKKEGDVANILVDGVNIISPTYSGLEFRGFGDQFVQNGEKYSPELLAKADGAVFSNITLQNVTVSDPGTESIDVLQNGPKGSVTLGPGINIQSPYIKDPSPTPQGWAGFFQGTSYPWTAQTSDPVVSWQQTFCDAVSAYVANCSSPDVGAACAPDPSADCSAYAAYYNAATMNAVEGCGASNDCNDAMLGSACVRKALASAALSPAQAGLANDYCGMCAANDGQATGDCVTGFWTDYSAGLGGPGGLALGYSDAVVSRIDSACVGSGDCGGFEACATNVIDSAAPVSSAVCLAKRAENIPTLNMDLTFAGDPDRQGQYEQLIAGLRAAVARPYRGSVLTIRPEDGFGLVRVVLSTGGQQVQLWFSKHNLYLIGFTNNSGTTFQFSDTYVNLPQVISQLSGEDAGNAPQFLGFGSNYISLTSPNNANQTRDTLTVSYGSLTNAVRTLASANPDTANGRDRQGIARALLLLIQLTAEAARFQAAAAIGSQITATSTSLSAVPTDVQELENNWGAISDYAVALNQDPSTPPRTITNNIRLNNFTDVAGLITVITRIRWGGFGGPAHTEL
ncbi:MAG TPA: ribosome-inactivating family protein [Polyangiaceae bacterium]|jgi:hypothetical protein